LEGFSALNEVATIATFDTAFAASAVGDPAFATAAMTAATDTFTIAFTHLSILNSFNLLTSCGLQLSH
jgi:hypothetical protein